MNTEILWETLFLSLYLECRKTRDSAVGTATVYGMNDQGVGVRVLVRARIFISPCRPDRLWDSPSLLSNGYRG
jgi:hypothetical protein